MRGLLLIFLLLLFLFFLFLLFLLGVFGEGSGLDLWPFYFGASNRDFCFPANYHFPIEADLLLVVGLFVEIFLGMGTHLCCCASANLFGNCVPIASACFETCVSEGVTRKKDLVLCRSPLALVDYRLIAGQLVCSL